MAGGLVSGSATWRVGGERAGLVALDEPVVGEAAEHHDADEQDRAPLQVPVERLRGVVDRRPRPGQVDRDPGAPDHREDVDGQAPAPEREVARRRVLRAPLPAQPGEQHRPGHEQVGDVDHDDPDAGDHHEDLRLADVHHQDRDREHADDDGRDDRRLGLRVDAGELIAGGQVVVPRHREHHADRGGVNGEVADRDGDHHAPQERVADRAAEDVEHDELQAAGADLLRVDIGDGHHREQQDQAADDERGDQCPQDRARRVLARVQRLLAERGSRCRTRTSRRSRRATRPGTRRGSRAPSRRRGPASPSRRPARA